MRMKREQIVNLQKREHGTHSTERFFMTPRKSYITIGSPFILFYVRKCKNQSVKTVLIPEPDGVFGGSTAFYSPPPTTWLFESAQLPPLGSFSRRAQAKQWEMMDLRNTVEPRIFRNWSYSSPGDTHWVLHWFYNTHGYWFTQYISATLW